MSSESENSKPEEELWLICPICKEPNPAGTLHCQHCWGASLYSVEPITSAELAKITNRKQSRQKRLNTIKIVTVSFMAPILLSLVVFLSLYYFTDIVMAPSPTLSSSPLPGEWTMFRRDLGRTGSTSLRGEAPQGTLKWVFSASASIHSSPAVVDGVVYFGSQDFKLYALNAETGAKLWEYQAESWIESSPAVANGIVYFGSNDGKLYAVNALTGEKLWDFTTHYPVKSSPAVANGMVYFGSDDYTIYALDAVTGTKVWSLKTGGYVSSSPAVAKGIVYFGSMDGACYALNAENGRFRLRFKSGSVSSSPAVRDGVVYFNSSGFLYALDGIARNWPGEGDLRAWWLQFYAFRLAPAPPPISGYLWRLRIGRVSTSSPVVVNGTIYTAADNKLYSIDSQTREIGWTFQADGNLRSSPAFGYNTLYIGSEDGRVYAVDSASGKKVWDFPAEDKITSSPALAKGILYIGSHDGNLYAIE